MAKKQDKIESLDIESAIIKQFGDIFQNASKLKEEAPIVIPTTPQMDLMLSGGIPEGSFVIVSGPPGLGKSAISLHIAGNAQKIPSQFGEREVYYFDIEGRLKARDVETNYNVDPSKIKIIRSQLGNIMMAEEFIDIAERIITEKPGAICILDSFSALCTRERKDANIGDRFRDNTPILLSSFVKRINQAIPVNKSIVIGITHMIANQSGRGQKMWIEASGQKIQYQADVKIRGTYTSAWKMGEQQIGQDVHWECEKSALGPPHQKCTSKLRYNYGFDQEAEILDLCIDFGLIKKSGAWYNYKDPESEESISKYGKDWIQLFKEDKEMFNKFRKMVISDAA